MSKNSYLLTVGTILLFSGLGLLIFGAAKACVLDVPHEPMDYSLFALGVTLGIPLMIFAIILFTIAEKRTRAQERDKEEQLKSEPPDEPTEEP